MSEARLKRKTIKLSIMLVGMCIGLWRAPALIEKFTGGGSESLLMQYLPGGAAADLSALKQGGLNAEGTPLPPGTIIVTPGERAKPPKGKVTATESNTRSRSSSSSARVVRGGS